MEIAKLSFSNFQLCFLWKQSEKDNFEIDIPVSFRLRTLEPLRVKTQNFNFKISTFVPYYSTPNIFDFDLFRRVHLHLNVFLNS
jgi:hypothetical protein